MELRIERTGEYKRVSDKLTDLRLEFISLQSLNPDHPRLETLRVEMAFLKRSLIIMDYERDGKEPPAIFRRKDPEE